MVPNALGGSPGSLAFLVGLRSGRSTATGRRRSTTRTTSCTSTGTTRSASGTVTPVPVDQYLLAEDRRVLGSFAEDPADDNLDRRLGRGLGDRILKRLADVLTLPLGHLGGERDLDPTARRQRIRDLLAHTSDARGSSVRELDLDFGVEALADVLLELLELLRPRVHLGTDNELYRARSIAKLV
jgi:hypothetical protein